MHAECVFVAGIHPSRTWTSGTFESALWNACVHRLTSVYTLIRKSFWRMESKSMLTPREKSSLSVGGGGGWGGSLQRRIEATTLYQAGQRPEHTINELFQPSDCPSEFPCHIARMEDNTWTKTLHRVATKEREEIKRTTFVEEETTWNRKTTEDNGRHWWRASSCSGWTKPRWKSKAPTSQCEWKSCDNMPSGVGWVLSWECACLPTALTGLSVSDGTTKSWDKTPGQQANYWLIEAPCLCSVER